PHRRGPRAPASRAWCPFLPGAGPRPPAVNVSVGLPGLATVYVLCAPKPWPTTLIAIVAMPACASDDATAHAAPFIESVNPWPKIATGQPPAGFAPDGTKSVKTRLSMR